MVSVLIKLQNQVYGQSDLDWVVLITAGIINVNNEWPLNSRELYEFALKKYGAFKCNKAL